MLYNFKQQKSTNMNTLAKNTVHYHEKFNFVYEGVTTQNIEGNIGRSRFAKGTSVKVVLALSEVGLSMKVTEKLRKWRSDAGGMSVLCDDVQEETAAYFEKEILDDIEQYDVWVISYNGQDAQMDFEEAKSKIKLLGKLDMYPVEHVISSVIYSHNKRVA